MMAGEGTYFSQSGNRGANYLHAWIMAREAAGTPSRVGQSATDATLGNGRTAQPLSIATVPAGRLATELFTTQTRLSGVTFATIILRVFSRMNGKASPDDLQR